MTRLFHPRAVRAGRVLADFAADRADNGAILLALVLSCFLQETGAFIRLRQFKRAGYDGRPLSAEVMRALAKAGVVEGVDLLLPTARPDIERVGELVVTGNITPRAYTSPWPTPAAARRHRGMAAASSETRGFVTCFLAGLHHAILLGPWPPEAGPLALGREPSTVADMLAIGRLAGSDRPGAVRAARGPMPSAPAAADMLAAAGSGRWTSGWLT